MADGKSSTSTPAMNQSTLFAWLVAGVGLLSLGLVFRDGITDMVAVWNRTEEYSHGFLIPPVAFYLLWLRARQLGGLSMSGSWVGVFCVLLGVAGFLLGELSGIYIILQYSLLLALSGFVFSAIGWRGLAICWVPLVYLIFMVPLPDFLEQKLSGQLQLISSEWGVAVIRAFGISVFLEGNVIDLGTYQLQVAEACSGLRYLFPLMSFGFLCAALFKAPWWQRTILFVSTVPLTIIMNSFRIGVIGVLVENFGIEQAEGFLHYFEGWIVFMVCVAILFLMMWAFNRMNGKGEPLLQAFGLDVPPVDDLRALIPQRAVAPAVVSGLVLAAAVILSLVIGSREDLIPERQRLSSFPLAFEGWRGQDGVIDQVYLDALQVDDYISAFYTKEPGQPLVELWIAYYESQKKGQSAHSPRTCLPGGGWLMESLTQVEVEDVGASGEGLEVNRVVISRANSLQLVYYWFVERGRPMTNEYLVKWHIFWDSLTKNRTDGALVRLVTRVGDRSNLPEADARMEQFIRALDPQLAYFIPQENATFEPGSRVAANPAAFEAK